MQYTRHRTVAKRAGRAAFVKYLPRKGVPAKIVISIMLHPVPPSPKAAADTLPRAACRRATRAKPRLLMR